MAAILYAATAPIPPAMRWYLRVQAAYIPFVWGVFYLLGQHPLYTIVYSIATVVCLAVVAMTALFGLAQHPEPIWPMLGAPFISAMIAVVALPGIHHPTAGMCIQVAEAMVLVTAGTALGLCAPFYMTRHGRMTALTFSVLWLLQAAFRYTYVMHIGQESWEIANEVIPPMLIVGACGWLGGALRHYKVRAVAVRA